MTVNASAARLEDGYVRRFSASERVEHSLLVVAFTILVITGLPQKLYGAPGAAWVVLTFGGIDNVRFIHRVFAAVFTIQSLYHLCYVVSGLLWRRFRASMVPQWKDFCDAWQMLRYCFGLADHEPTFDRFTYREKFEYWGVVLGAAIMIISGAILWFPTLATRWLPGELVPAAKEMHGGEALLAFLVIVVWHLYGVHLSPLRFPGDLSIFTGRISRKRMLEEHPLEYARMAEVAPTPGEEVCQVPTTVSEGGASGLAARTDLRPALDEEA